MSIRKWLNERLRSDEGLSLIECMVALVIFGIAAGGLSFALQAAGHTSANNRLRVQASNLAARELEIDRNEFNSSAAGPATLGATGSVTNPHNLSATAPAASSLVIDGVPFTLTRDVQWLPTGSGESPCDGGSAVVYPSLKVTTTVTWANMGNTKPVTNSTLLTPPKTLVTTADGITSAAPGPGFIAIKVTGADGLGIDNLPVVFSKAATASQTRFTESDGCAVFSTMNYGSWTATLNSAGYVTTDLFPSRAISTSVGDGTLSQLAVSYDRSATIAAVQGTIGGYGLPNPLPPLTIYNTGLPSPNTKKFTTGIGVTTTLAGLWPWQGTPGGYSIWAGSCDQSTPASRPAGLPLTAGGSITQPVALAPVDFLVKTRVGSVSTNTSGAALVATPLSSAGCVAGDTLSLGTTDTNGQLKTSLPAGQYTVRVTGRSTYNATAWPLTPASMPTTTATTIPTITLAP
jgi:prepilin-type N-terminal cleavage/methylation domain-containing protein